LDPKLWELAREHRQYAYEAYEFVCEAVSFTHERVYRVKRPTTTRDQHINGEELLRGACELAVREYGLMAPIVFRQWGLHRTDDIGTIVFLLIELGKLSRSDRDDPADFQNRFDLHEALVEGFELNCAEYLPRRGER
jgi:uncharacterized repeat protein (TIGR04138 family)